MEISLTINGGVTGLGNITERLTISDMNFILAIVFLFYLPSKALILFIQMRMRMRMRRLVKGLRLFTYDLVADPGFSDCYLRE